MCGRARSLGVVGAVAAVLMVGAQLEPVAGQSNPGHAPVITEAPPPSMQRISCERVISKIDQQVRRTNGQPADMSQVARQLGTHVIWVEHCMLAYGRRPKRPGYESAEARDERLEALEADEPEESGPEDVEEPGARERPEHPEKERVLRIKPPPTPSGHFQWNR
jgi:hypothetical protein